MLPRTACVVTNVSSKIIARTPLGRMKEAEKPATPPMKRVVFVDISVITQPFDFLFS